MNWYAQCALNQAKKQAVEELENSIIKVSTLIKEVKLSEDSINYFVRQINEMKEAVEQIKDVK